jgi:hypothetical protein
MLQLKIQIDNKMLKYRMYFNNPFNTIANTAAFTQKQPDFGDEE